MTTSYTVEVRTGPLDAEVHPAQLDRFASTLFEDKTIAGPAFTIDGAINALEVRASVDETRTVEAITVVVKAIERALRAAHIVATQSRIEAWPDMVGVEWPDELVNGGEVARRLQLSRERVRQMLAEEPPQFPRPVAETERDKIWRWGDVAEWAAATARKTKVRRRRKDNTINLFDALKRSVEENRIQADTRTTRRAAKKLRGA
jgi:predicted DNA-binding transcriptional regulator AlpA